MRRLDDLSEASKLAFSSLKPGVLTNHVMTADEYREDINRKLLFTHTWPGGVFFLRKREGYHILSYIISDTSILPQCVLPDDSFIEIAYKSGGACSAAKASEFWVKAGFKLRFERIRLSRPSGICDEAAKNICLAKAQDIDGCNVLLRTCFDRKTGYLPDFDELMSDITKGHVICMKDSHNRVCGLLRCQMRAASVEIRQLAIREDMRGRGLARHLINFFLSIWDEKKSIVWMEDGYAPALKSYISVGFSPDGWRSLVLTYCL